MTKLRVKEITLTHEIDGGEPWPEDAGEVISESNSEESALTVEWDLEQKPDDEANQPNLFDVSEEE